MLITLCKPVAVASSFFNRVVKVWNGLLSSIVNLNSFDTFKIRINIHKLRIHCRGRALSLVLRPCTS